MSQPSAFDFQYFISEKNGFVVASLVGLLDQRCLAKFEELNIELSNSEFRKLIINFRDVTGVTAESIPVVALLQKMVRAREAELRLCGLKPEVKERLFKAGILRPHELTDNLRTALQSMISGAKKVA